MLSDSDDAAWLDAQIDHALSCAERAWSWAADVRIAPAAWPGCNADALEASAVAFDLVAHQLASVRGC